MILVVLAGCEPKGPYPLSEEEVMRFEKSLPGEIYLTAGSTFGPYQRGPEMVANENTAGTFSATKNAGLKHPLSWPAVPGYYFETHSYVSQLDDWFYVIRKVPVAEKAR